MNRRNFLRGLIGSAVTLTAAPILLEEVSRVYSFPTNIVIAQPGFSPVSFSHGIQQSLVVFYDKKFIANLKDNTPFDACSRRLSLPDASGVQRYLAPYVYDPLDLSSDFED